jgi:hypothetical protein
MSKRKLSEAEWIAAHSIHTFSTGEFTSVTADKFAGEAVKHVRDWFFGYEEASSFSTGAVSTGQGRRQ